MPRPCKCRRVCFIPGVTYFKPAGIPLRALVENCLSFEEVEAIRLRDQEHLEQAECAARMNISRPTFQRVLASARKKIADSLIGGKALRIEGGNYTLAVKEISQGPRRDTMKIAVVSDDGKTISQHFGRARQYVVLNAEDGKVINRETRPKAGHGDFSTGEEHEHNCGCHAHGHEPGDSEKHGAMAANIQDCSVLLAGGMGWGAYESLKGHGIEPVITDLKEIDQAARLFLEGKLPNLMTKLH